MLSLAGKTGKEGAVAAYFQGNALYVVSVKSAIINDGKVLLLKKKKGIWDLPGGKLEGREDIESCLIREAKEEIGLKIANIAVVHGGIRRRPMQPPRLVLVCTAESKTKVENIKLSPEHSEFTWITAKDLKKYELPDVLREGLSVIFERLKNAPSVSEPYVMDPLAEI